MFGHYEQDGDPAETEQIVWIVIETGEEGVTLLSEKALDTQPYNSYNKKCGWANCSLRTWLNEVFVENAFNDEEQALLRTHELRREGVEDRVWILSENELKQVFPSDAMRKVKITEYAAANNGWRNGNGYGYYWTRSNTVGEKNSAAFVASDGKTGYYYCNARGRCVRPVILVDPKGLTAADD